MYLDIPANDNLDEPAMATFKEEGPPQPIRRVRLWREDGWHWCAITGWNVGGPVPAHVQRIEESGDGPALLIHGGPWGLRLAAQPDPALPVRWNLDDPEQWAEPFLLVRPDCAYEAA